MPHWPATPEQVAARRELQRRLRELVGPWVYVSPRTCRRAVLFVSDPRCWWCGVETVWWSRKEGPLPDHAATVDHLFPRGHPEHGKHARSTVLACYGCNHLRGEEWIRHHLAKPCVWPRCWEARPHEHEPRTAGVWRLVA